MSEKKITVLDDKELKNSAGGIDLERYEEYRQACDLPHLCPNLSCRITDVGIAMYPEDHNGKPAYVLTCPHCGQVYYGYADGSSSNC